MSGKLEMQFWQPRDAVPAFRFTTLNQEGPIHNSLLSKLSNVKDRAINAGTKAFTIASELANKSLEPKFSKKEEVVDTVNEIQETVKSDDKIEPTFFSNEDNNLNAYSSGLNANDSSNIEENITIPSFLRRNKD